jgi:Hemerythrin HHE cation binding domain
VLIRIALATAEIYRLTSGFVPLGSGCKRAFSVPQGPSCIVRCMDTAFAPTTEAPDLAFFRAAHAKARKDLARNVQAVETAVEADRMTRLQPLARWARGLAHELSRHLRREDEVVFPALRGREPAVAGVLAALADDREALDALLARWPAVAARLADRNVPFGPAKAEAVELAAAIEERVLRRLDLVDLEVLPVLSATYGAADYDALIARAERHRTSSAALGRADRTARVARANPPVRLVWKLHKGRYERLVTAAFGNVGEEPAIAVDF